MTVPYENFTRGWIGQTYQKGPSHMLETWWGAEPVQASPKVTAILQCIPVGV